jgi:hypothetical protein
MAKVRFFGPLNNHSGYGNAVMNFAKAFSMSSIDTKFNFSKQNKQPFVDGLNNYSGKTNIDFYLHCPPYTKHKSSAYKIAYFYWEADRLPRNWSRSLNKVNELWVPCNLVKKACVRAKFNGPIKVIPTPCNDWETQSFIDFPSSFSDDFVISNDVYKFYSIFQWHNRKGWRSLLSSYYKAFNEGDQVVLILKVNSLNIAGYTTDMIKPDIAELKRKLNLKYYPPVYLSTTIVPSDSIKALHNTADCYVAPHHGEGWGMPIHDAMRMENQIITTKYGGVTEYLDDSSAHIIKHTLGPVGGMDWSPLYGAYQNWAHPSNAHLTRIFRDVYENHSSYKDKAMKARQIADTMRIEMVSKMLDRELSER